MTAEVMMKEYKNMKKELTVTEFQLRQFQGVSEQDMIDSMLYSHQEGERVQTSTLSDKTANIAIKYKAAMERENDEWYDFLFHRYMFLKEELDFFEHAVNGLDERHRSIITDTETAAGFITEQGGCSGVTFADGIIEFTGFPHTDNMMEYCRLASAIVKKASEQKRVNPKQTIEENEKYYMRAWLVSIGFGGSEGKKTRSFFLKGLKGHTAFRTPEDAERWKANRRAERGATVCSE